MSKKAFWNGETTRTSRGSGTAPCCQECEDIARYAARVLRPWVRVAHVFAAIAVCLPSACSDQSGIATAATAATTAMADPAVLFPQGPPSIAVFGDSQTAGTWLPDPPAQAWPIRLAERICPQQRCLTNHARGGQPLVLTTTGTEPIVETAVSSFNAADPPHIAIVMAGQVDLISSDDIEAIVDGYHRLAEALADAGVQRVVFVTLLPYDPTTYPHPEWLPTIEARRVAINDRLRDDWAESGRLYDIEPVVSVVGTHDLRPEFATKDGNHLSVDGAQAIADAFPLHILVGEQ